MLGVRGNVTQLPKEGSILGEDSSATPSSDENGGDAAGSENQNLSEQKTGLINWMITHKKITLGIVALILLGYWYFRRERK